MINKEPSDAAEKLSSELDARLAVIKDLIQADHERYDAWKHAWSSVYMKYAFRLYGIDPQPSETLLAHAMKLVELPQRFSRSELDQLATRYQWEAIKSWASIHVTVVTTVRVNGPRHGEQSMEVEGMNSEQWSFALGLFGPRAARGKIFAEGPLFLPDINGWVQACRRWSAKERRKVKEHLIMQTR